MAEPPVLSPSTKSDLKYVAFPGVLLGDKVMLEDYSPGKQH